MANTRYDNFVLENMLTEALTTQIELSNYMTIDDSLVENAGMTKKVNTYSSTGDVEDVAEGSGNTASIEMSYTTSTYDVGTTQGRFIYTDEDEMSDPFLVDNGINHLAKKLTNKMVEKTVAEWKKATLQQGYASTISTDTIIDAIGLLNKENDEEAGLFLLINPSMKAAMRKALGDDLKYSEGFARTGYIGTVCGVPVITSKAIDNNIAILASKKAVTCFVKKNASVSSERNENTRTNTIYGRMVNVVALTDAKEVVFIGKNPTTATTITTSAAGAKTVAGAATTGAVVKVYINGKLDGTTTAASSAYSYTATANLASGDKIKVVAQAEGQIASIKEVVVD